MHRTGRAPLPDLSPARRARSAVAPRTAWLLLALIATVLAACAPTAREQAQVTETPTGPLAYHPHPTGATWSYLPERASLDEGRVVTRVEGPTVLAGEVRTAWRLAGRGLDMRMFREHRSDGTYLVRTERPGTILRYDPPIFEMPDRELRVGDRWDGSTTVTTEFPDARSENRFSVLDVDYVTTVVDRREVTVPAGTFEVFVLNFTTRTLDEDGEVTEEFTQERWFAPYLGLVRTEQDHFLLESNLIDLPRQP
ncbi:MAG: hypothetical protein WD336_02040 [Trueperaceae bacterium]